MISVLVTGALGRMGRHVLSTVNAQADMELAAAVDQHAIGEQLSQIIPGMPSHLTVHSDLEQTIIQVQPQVLVDFTTPGAAGRNGIIASRHGVRPVIGTTGLPPAEVAAIEAECCRQDIGGAVIANFSIGAMLLEIFAAAAAEHMSSCEIIELHHDRKLDAPSGTARDLQRHLQTALDRSIPVHSVRLPGLVAHHRIMFGADGETLTLSHDSSDRTSFMPGVIRAIHAVMNEARFFSSLRELTSK